MRHVLWCVMLLLLSGCGFQLRGSTPLSPPLQQVYIKTADPYGQLARNLRDYLQASGANITDTPQQATTVLEILSDDETQQLLSVSGTQQTRQYNLILSVKFAVANAKGTIVVPEQVLTETRAFTTTSDQILGGTNEQSTLYQQMRQAIVYDIMNRLNSREITTILMKQKTSS